MAPELIPANPPLGYRFMLADEADRLQYADTLTLLTSGGIEHGTVRGHTDEKMHVALRSGGAVLSLDLDCPDYWPEGECRDRRPPFMQDVTGEWAVAIVRENAEDEPDLELPLKASVQFGNHERRLASIEKELVALRAAVAERLGAKVA